MARLLSIAAGVHPDLAPTTMVEVAAAAGWPACGIWFDPDTWNEDTTHEVRRRLADTGVVGLDLEPVILSPDGPDPGERLIEAAAALGVRNVLFTSRLPDAAATADRFAELCSVAAPLGVRLACEFLPAFPLSNLAIAEAIVQNHDPEVAGILVDNLHLSRSGGVPADLARVDPRRFPYLQVADAPAELPSDFRELAREAMHGRSVPGDGALPIDELLAAVPAVPLSFEVRSRALRDGWPDPVERASMLLSRVRGLEHL
ncbi:MAG: sugar phosphate isomerase/epimerase family protein [Ilumatobacteraceae bacterium]